MLSDKLRIQKYIIHGVELTLYRKILFPKVSFLDLSQSEVIALKLFPTLPVTGANRTQSCYQHSSLKQSITTDTVNGHGHDNL